MQGKPADLNKRPFLSSWSPVFSFSRVSSPFNTNMLSVYDSFVFFVKNLIFFLPLQNLLFYYDSEQSTKPTGVIFLEVRLPMDCREKPTGAKKRKRKNKIYGIHINDVIYGIMEYM